MRIFLFLIMAYGVIILTSLSAFADKKQDTATLAGGCFWCLESDISKLDGVIDAVSGYAGGDRPNPTYENYHDLTDLYKTPHIEVVQVTYDPQKLSYEDLLNYYVRHIDPTDNGGQFCDRGPAYRPAIFVQSDSQHAIASNVLKETSKLLNTDIKIDILPDAPFFKAEDYHQDYSLKNPTRYKFYRWNCGRDQTISKIWGNAKNEKLDTH